MLGIVQDKQHLMSLNFKGKSDLIFLLGESLNDISSSEYLASFHGCKESPAPPFDLEKEYQLQELVKNSIKQKHIESAHDVADGGLFITLLESAMPNQLGFDITTSSEIRTDAFIRRSPPELLSR